MLPVIRDPIYCQEKPKEAPGSIGYGIRVTLPVFSIPNVTMIRSPVDVTVLENARRKRLGRGGKALRNRRAVIGYDTFVLEVKFISSIPSIYACVTIQTSAACIQC